MSLTGTMNTAVSGMNAQSSRLSSISDNIANSDTIGYKRSKVSFSSFLLPSTGGSYESGSVESILGRDVSVQGELTSSTTSSNIAISGEGFFVVQSMQGQEFLTRAGDFEMDSNGDLVNSAGFALLGYSYAKGVPANQINGLSGLDRINLRDELPRSAPTKNIGFSSTLDVRKPLIDATDLPRTNTSTAKYDHKTSVTAYDSLGREVRYDVYFSKKKEAAAGPPAVEMEWDVSIFRADKATNGGFPYTGVPTNNSATFTFDSQGSVTSAAPSISITDSVTVPAQTIKFDFSKLKVQAAEFTPTENNVDGHASSWVTKASIDKDGIVYAVYSGGTRDPRFRIPLANVQSPDHLEALSGNVFLPTRESGTTFTGFPGEGIFGTTLSGKLEKSNSDLASELTDMIQAQRNYTANSKAFQTGSELMDVLISLKR